MRVLASDTTADPPRRRASREAVDDGHDVAAEDLVHRPVLVATKSGWRPSRVSSACSAPRGGVDETGDPLRRGRERDPASGLAGAAGEAEGEVGLPVPGGPSRSPDSRADGA